MRKLAVITLFLAFVFVPGLGAANIVLNPGFETGSFSPWVPYGDSDTSVCGGACAHTGAWGAEIGGNSSGFIPQTLATTPGADYGLSFWIADHSDYTGTHAFEVWWGGNLIHFEGAGGGNAWTRQEFPVTASGASTDLEFYFHTYSSGYYYFDDVSVEQVAGGVPEPSSLILAGLGVAALVLRRRKRAA
jgi:hypothetical protein